MANENPYAKYKAQSQPVPVSEIKPIIAAPTPQPDPYKPAAEARAETGTQLDVQGEARAGRKERFDYATQLRTEFRKAPETTNYETVIRQFSSALGAEATPTGDQALITAYAKMLDPGSVVREQEFNTVQAGDSKLGQIVARLQKELGVDESGLIRPEVRYRVLREMKNLADNYRAGYDRARTDYEALAGNYGIDPNVVLGTRIDTPYQDKIEKLWKSKGVDETAAQGTPVQITGGERFSTEQDIAYANALTNAARNGASVQELAAIAEQFGITGYDVGKFQQAVELAAQGKLGQFLPTKSGIRNPISQALGEAAMTPAGTALVGATNAATLGGMSLLAGDKVQGLEALNPKSAIAGEIAGSMVGTAGLAKGAAAGLKAVAPGLSERLLGGGIKGAVAREALTEGTYGGAYAANTGQDIGTGVALGAVGSLGGQALGAAGRRVLGRAGDIPPGGGPDIPPDGGLGGGTQSAMPDAGASNAPITRNRLYSDKIMGPEYKAGDVLPKYGMRNISGPDELQDIIQSGFVRSRKEGGAKYYTMTDAEVPPLGNANAGKPIIRIKSENIPEGRAARAEDVEIWNNDAQMWLPLVSRTSEEPFVPYTVRSNDAGSAGTSPETLRRTQAEGLPVPIELTRGAATRDAEQLAFEKEQLYGALGGPLRKRAEENNVQALENFDRLIDMTGAQAPDIAATGNAVIGALAKGYQAAKNKVNVAYKRADMAGETQELVDYRPILDYIAQQPTTTVDQIAPILKTVAEQLRKNDPDGVGQITIRDLEEVRKLINKNVQYGTPNANYGGQLKGLIDEVTDGAGGKMYQEARKLRIEQARKFENRAIVARLVSNVKNMDDPRVAADKVFQKSILNAAPEEIQFLRRTLRTSGPEGRQAWKELQGATIRHIQEVATSGVNLTSDNLPVISTAKLNQELSKLDKNGRLDVIFDPKTAQTLRDLRDVVQYVNTVPPGTSINTSGTARTLIAALAEMGTLGATTGLPLPVISGLKLLRDGIKDAKIKAKIAKSLIPSEPR